MIDRMYDTDYSTLTFSELFPTAEDWTTFYSNCGIPTTITEGKASAVWFLLYAEYANSPIASSDTNRARLQAMSIMYQYASTWEKKMSIQTVLRGLTEDEILAGSKTYSAHGNHSGKGLSIDAVGDTEGVNEYTGQRYMKSKLEGYANLYSVLDDDITREFLSKFKKLFKSVVSSELYHKYEIEEEMY